VLQCAALHSHVNQLPPKCILCRWNNMTCMPSPWGC
jgi:hypothetical protein